MTKRITDERLAEIEANEWWDTGEELLAALKMERAVNRIQYDWISTRQCGDHSGKWERGRCLQCELESSRAEAYEWQFKFHQEEWRNNPELVEENARYRRVFDELAKLPDKWRDDDSKHVMPESKGGDECAYELEIALGLRE